MTARDMRTVQGPEATTRLREALARLRGLPLTCACHAGNLAMFDFGLVNKIVTHSGWEYFSDYALHVQCGWQLSCGDQIVAGSADLALRSSDAQGGADRDTSLLTARMRELNENQLGRLAIVAAELAPGKQLRIHLTHDHQLNVIPLTSNPDDQTEFWRLIANGGTRPHFVVGPGQLTIDEDDA